jgi:DNA-directed RNA polymerase specialized sigma24 family protein
MAPEGSVTHWLGQLRAGDAAAAQPLWERYIRRLVGLARKQLHGRQGRVADEEDIALSAFDSFCRIAAEGRFPELADRDSLWQLLVVITARKAAHTVRDEGRKKRGGGMFEAGVSLDEMLSREPTPDFAAQTVEEYERLLAALPDRELAAVAVWRMEGFSVEEIAARLGYAPRSIKRKLSLIRGVWEKEIEP